MTTLELKNRVRDWPVLQPLIGQVRKWRLRQAMRAFDATGLPACVIVELTNVCNLKCAKCPTYDAARGRGMMTPELYAKLLADIAAGDGTTTLSFNGGGEAILHPQIVDFVRQAAAVPNITGIGITTNVLALDSELAERLLEAGVTWLKVSLDTVDAAMYERMNRVNGYETVVRNLKELCRIRNERGYPCDITLKVTLYKRDPELVERIRALWVDHVDRIRVTGMHNWGGLRGKRDANVRQTPCEYLWEQVQVLWDGQMTLCCWDSMEGYYNMGNLNDVDLARYWKHDPKLRAIRRSHLNTDFSTLKLCATCNADTYITAHYFRNPARPGAVRRERPRRQAVGVSDRT